MPAALTIDLVCTDPAHPMTPVLADWIARARAAGHDAALIHELGDLRGGDLLLLAACQHVVGAATRARYRRTLVTHASDLPEGRGWSPLVWTILSGSNRIVLSLIEAEDRVDTGAVWMKTEVDLEGHEVFAEINERVFPALAILFDHAIAAFHDGAGEPQAETGASHWPRRTPEDSRLDPEKTIAEQFDLMRVSDPDRYPAFFDLRGHRYEIVLHKAGKGR